MTSFALLQPRTPPCRVIGVKKRASLGEEAEHFNNQSGTTRSIEALDRAEALGETERRVKAANLM
jgi:hypothetical protein